MSFQPIKSGMIDGARYDAEKKSLDVRFKNGSVYQYSDVPKELYENFAKTFDTNVSSGKFLNKHIKKFKVKKLG